jgi:hypothetical protein
MRRCWPQPAGCNDAAANFACRSKGGGDGLKGMINLFAKILVAHMRKLSRAALPQQPQQWHFPRQHLLQPRLYRRFIKQQHLLQF